MSAVTKDAVEEWIVKLNLLIQICDLWMEVQYKWLFIERVFANNEFDMRLTEEMFTYNSIVKEFKVKT